MKQNFSAVGADAYIGPRFCTGIFVPVSANRKHLRRGDVGIAPYGSILQPAAVEKPRRFSVM